MIKIKLNFNIKQQTETEPFEQTGEILFAVNITLNENMITFLL